MRPPVAARRLRIVDDQTVVRTDKWKLVHFVDWPDGQLFDLSADPGETHNLWDDPSAADTKQELLDVLRDWRIRSDVNTAGWAAGFREVREFDDVCIGA